MGDFTNETKMSKTRIKASLDWIEITKDEKNNAEIVSQKNQFVYTNLQRAVLLAGQ